MIIIDVTANKNCHCTGITTITNKPLGHFIPQLLSWPIFLHLNGCGIIWLYFSPLGLVPSSFPVNTKMPLQVRIASGPFLPLKECHLCQQGKNKVEQLISIRIISLKTKNIPQGNLMVFVFLIKLKVKENNSMCGPCTL